MKFVVLSYPRSGSTWLVDALNNIPGVTCYDELFTLKNFQYRAGGKGFPRYVDWKKSKSRFIPAWRYLNQLYAETNKMGFKLTFYQVRQHPALLAYALINQVRVIHLVRQNTLDLELSLLAAKERGKFHYNRGEYIPSQPPIYVDPAHLVKKMQRVRQSQAFVKWTLKSLRLKSIEVFYEDLLADKKNFRPIWDFLEADYDEHPPEWQLERIMKKSHSQSILNYEEIERALQMAGYGHFLNP